MTLPPDRFFNHIYAWCVARVKNRDEWDNMLIEPMPTTRRKAIVHKPTQAEIENEGADFMNFMGTMTG